MRQAPVFRTWLAQARITAAFSLVVTPVLCQLILLRILQKRHKPAPFLWYTAYMKRAFRLIKTAVSVLLILCLLPLPSVIASDAGGSVTTRKISDSRNGDYTMTTVSGLTPYVFMPTGTTSAEESDFMNVAGMMNVYGEQNRFVCAINAGIFYASDEGRWYGFNHKEADGPVICNGVVLRSPESVDHTECTLLVVDADGAIGYAPFDTDVDALAAGTATWFDIHGEPVTGRPIVSAVTGFVPIVINGKNVYSSKDKNLHGYMNYVGHYTRSATRQVLGVKEDGTILLFTDEDGWTLLEAAKVAINQGCVFAYNLDGGKSAQTVLGHETENGYETEIVVGKGLAARTVPTFIVFTADNCMPVSADPIGWEVEITDTPFAYSEACIPGCLRVTVSYLNANGKLSYRTLISSAAAEPGPIPHKTWGGSTEYKNCHVVHTGESRAGVLICTMTPTESEGCIAANRNTRLDGKYYDYSSGYSVILEEDGVTLLYSTGDIELYYHLPYSLFEAFEADRLAFGSSEAVG